MKETYAYRDGNLIGVYKSTQEASRALGVSSTTIIRLKNEHRKGRKGLRVSNEPIADEILEEDRKTNTLDAHNFYDELDERSFVYPTKGTEVVAALEKYIATNIRPTVMRMDKNTAKLHKLYLEGLFAKLYRRLG